MKKGQLIFIFILMLCLFCGCRNSSESNKQNLCCLCKGLPYHAPCLLNPATGEILELAVYDNHPTHQGELAEAQTSGYATFILDAGTSAIRLAGVSCSTSLEDADYSIDPSHFCDSCAARIMEITENGCVLADLYDLENIQLYAAKEDSTYFIRDYTVQITADPDSNQLNINVTV